jgi:hypothetical protein
LAFPVEAAFRWQDLHTRYRHSAGDFSVDKIVPKWPLQVTAGLSAPGFAHAATAAYAVFAKLPRS